MITANIKGVIAECSARAGQTKGIKLENFHLTLAIPNHTVAQRGHKKLNEKFHAADSNVLKHSSARIFHRYFPQTRRASNIEYKSARPCACSRHRSNTAESGCNHCRVDQSQGRLSVQTGTTDFHCKFAHLHHSNTLLSYSDNRQSKEAAANRTNADRPNFGRVGVRITVESLSELSGVCVRRESVCLKSAIDAISPEIRARRQRII